LFGVCSAEAPRGYATLGALSDEPADRRAQFWRQDSPRP
jgi:hypothetical protein